MTKKVKSKKTATAAKPAEQKVEKEPKVIDLTKAEKLPKYLQNSVLHDGTANHRNQRQQATLEKYGTDVMTEIPNKVGQTIKNQMIFCQFLKLPFSRDAYTNYSILFDHYFQQTGRKPFSYKNYYGEPTLIGKDKTKFKFSGGAYFRRDADLTPSECKKIDKELSDFLTNHGVEPTK